MKTLTVEYLKSIEACQLGIDFMVRNGLDSFPLDRLDEIDGDYNYFVDWLREHMDDEFIYDYDAVGNMIKKTKSNGIVYRYEYDTHGNMIKKTLPNNSVFYYDYDKFGNMVNMRWPGDSLQCEHDTNCWKWEYDEAGYKVKEITPEGKEHLYKNDDAGNLIEEIYPNGKIYRYEYDTQGNKVKDIYPNGVMCKYTYDDRGNMIESIDSYEGDCTQCTTWSFDHNEDGSFTVSEDEKVIMTVPTF